MLYSSSDRNTNQRGFTCPRCGAIVAFYISGHDTTRDDKMLKMKMRLHEKKCVPKANVDIDTINQAVADRIEAKRKLDKSLCSKAQHTIGNPTGINTMPII